MKFSIATWNVNSIRVRLPHVLEWLENEKPDVLAIQETKIPNDAFPKEEIEATGYSVIFNGQKTYNGMAVISKLPMEDVIIDLPVFDDPQRRYLAVTINGIRILNLYVPNGQSVDSDKYIYKLNWLSHLKGCVQREMEQYQKVLLLGDFNIAPEDKDVHDPKEWEGNVLVSPKERDALQAIMNLGLVDTFRLFEQGDNYFSWWDYRAAAFRRNRGLRIDHIFVSDALAKVCESCEIQKEPRKWERPSDHVPVIAKFSW